MKIQLPSNPKSMFWPTLLSIVLGVLAGIVLFYITARPQAQSITSLVFPNKDSALPEIQFIPKLSEKMNILLMGVDSNGKDTDRFSGTRSDTLMLACLDPGENRIGIVSIPRDCRVHIPGHGIEKINAAHALGGPELAMQTLRECFGTPIDHYIVVDTQGLKQLFEILGPVEVLVEKEMHYVDHSAKLNVDLKPGIQMLTPEQAEEYVRFRHDARGDIGRIERQQWFIRQATQKLKNPEIILKLPQLAGLAYECVKTDIPLQDILRIAAFAKDFPPEKVVTSMLPGEAQMINGGSYWIPDPLASQATFSLILGCSTGNIQPLQEEPPYPAQASSVPALEITLPEDSLPAPGLPVNYNKPPSICIKYPKGYENLSELLAQKLAGSGFKVKYRWQIPDCECQHEMLIRQSLKANETITQELCESVPEIKKYPTSLALEARPLSDFTIILSPSSRFNSLCQAPPALEPQAPSFSTNISQSHLLHKN